MRTLYEILEVSEKASKEVIEKAYKVLVKRYHPDLQTSENKAMAEKKMKEINEAYDILSDDVKRKEYDQNLLKERELKEQQTLNYQEQSPQKQYYTSGETQTEQRYRDMQRRKYEENLKKQEEQMRMQMEQNMQQEYQNAYYDYLRSLGYRIKEKWTWKKIKQLLITIIIMIGIIMILWFLPLTHDMMVEFYENNKIVKLIVDIILEIISAIIKTIGELFGDLFK